MNNKSSLKKNIIIQSVYNFYNGWHSVKNHQAWQETEINYQKQREKIDNRNKPPVIKILELLEINFTTTLIKMFKTKINEVKNNFTRYMTSRMRQMNIVVLKKVQFLKVKS